VARQAMWWLRRMVTAARPRAAARSTARSTAWAVSHTPGKRRPSQVSAVPLSLTTSGAPVPVIRPAWSSAR
jgi:hypothetical protein